MALKPKLHVPAPIGTCNIFSLNDRPVRVSMGQFQDIVVNPKPEGAPWGVTIVEDAKSAMDKGDDVFETLTTPARSLAEDLVDRTPGEGLFLADEDDLPSAEEVEAASSEFELADMSRIQEAHRSWDAKHDRNKISNQARDAARRRKQVVDWATNVVIELKPCEMCGENIRASAKKCRYCGSMIGVPAEPFSEPKPEPEPVAVNQGRVFAASKK